MTSMMYDLWSKSDHCMIKRRKYSNKGTLRSTKKVAQCSHFAA